MKKPPLILVVDDVKKMADVLARDIRQNLPGSITLTANSADEAVDIIEKNAIDAVVTDWVLDPQKKKLNALPVIKAAHKKDPTCVSIIFTGDPTAFNRYKHGYDEGAYDVILKVQVGVKLAREVAVKLQKALERREQFLRANTFARHIDHKLQDKLGPTPTDNALHSRWLTVMFTDIRGFSAVTDDMRAHPSIVADFLKELYAIIIECAHKHGGVVDKFMGDGSMILFGVAETYADHDPTPSMSAVNAALDMQDRCRGLIEGFRAKLQLIESVAPPRLALGIGINRAEALVGIISTPDRDQYTAVGHGVNLAARVESNAGNQHPRGTKLYGNILITSTVHGQVEKHFKLMEEPPLTNIRNIAKPHPVWSVKAR